MTEPWRLLAALLGTMAACAALAAPSGAPTAKRHAALPAAPKAAEKPAMANDLARLGGASRAKGTVAIGGSVRRH